MKLRTLSLLTAILLLTAASSSLLSPTARQTLRKGERCNECPRCCAAGLTCVGNPKNKRCFALRTAGQNCGKDPFWQCIPSLQCSRSGTCVDGSGVKESCNAPGDVCKAGLVCVGNMGNRRCFPPRKRGDKCGKDPFWECFGDRLVCNRFGMCVVGGGVKGQCNSPADACKPGLVCVGNVGNKRCFPPRVLGDKCGKDPFWDCVSGLTCSKAGMCVKGIGVKGACNAPGDVCETGLVCVGNVGNKRCFKPRLIGDKCGKDPFWICTKGRCVNNRCQ